MTVRRLVIRTTVTVTAGRLNVEPVMEVVITRDGVVGDMTAMKTTSVGDDRLAVG